MRTRLAEGFVALVLVGACVFGQSWAGDPGAAIYLDGRLPSGAPLIGERASGIHVEGRAAACVHCHRRSGLGSVEGRNTIPPIAGSQLFRPRAHSLEHMDRRFHQGYSANRDPYDDQTLARAIRSGVRRDGTPLDALMPRYDLDGPAMGALIGHLKGLSSQVSPGVDADTLHFATIITPDADPARRQAMLDVLQRFFADRSAFIRNEGRRMQVSSEAMFRNTRKWQLHVWDLTGPAETWAGQLQQRLAAEPVFAVISGLGRDWSPVHRFCQQAGLPCLLPNTDLPSVAEDDFYPVYLSQGVLLEARLAAQVLSEAGGQGIKRVVQVFRRDDVGAAAAATLADALARSDLKLEDRVLAAGTGVESTLAGLGEGDQLVLWLRPEDLMRLPVDMPAKVKLLASATLAGAGPALPSSVWRGAARWLYPYDLPELRKARMAFVLGWLRLKKIALVDERLQADTYLACVILADAVVSLHDNFQRDYLLERIEGMLSQRIQNAYYPRLGLAPGQRFASKGGYLVRFDAGGKLVADSEWIVP